MYEKVNNSQTRKYMDIGKEYFDKDGQELNENRSDKIPGGITSKFLEKLRESSFKVNLNISNNYYNSNYNVYNRKKENIDGQPNYKLKEKTESQDKTNQALGEEKLQNRLTVFISKLFLFTL